MNNKQYPYRWIIENSLYLSLVWVIYTVQKTYWQDILLYFEGWNFRLIYLAGISRVIFMSWLIFYGILYYLEIPFFEKFKIDPRPWPWKTDKKKWKRDLKKLLFTNFRNFYVIAPIVIRLLQGKKKINYSWETFPSL